MTLKLRPLRLSDASILIAWRNDPVVRKYARFTDPVELEGHLEWLRARVEGVAGELHNIFETSEGIPVGYVYTTFGEGRPTELHYRVAPEWRNKGIASSMLPLFLEENPKIFKDCTLVVPIIEGNVPSERLAANLGLHPSRRYPVSETDSRVLVDWVK